MSAVVYRAFDADGRLLYVGSTTNLASRIAYHSQHSPWWPFHSSIVTERHDEIGSAREAERAAIGTEHPRWNVQYRSPDHPDGVITHGRGRFGAPWLREEIKTWRAWLRERRASA